MQQENNITPRNALQPGYELLWYQVRSVLGQGAFGITYLAQDINLKRLVAIKEFLPGQYAMRDGNETVRPVSEDQQERFTWGLRRFIDEARILDQFEHPNIVRILNIFEANNTAYMVMRYEQGVSLKEILIRQKFLDESDLLNILFPILDGLEKIHEAGFIHRDIKPANIFIRTDGTPVLLDFGSARQSLEKETHTLTSLVSPGYAPIEQYVSKSDKQGPWSDIYGMAATMYRSVTGVPPIDAITRGESLTGNDQDNLINCRELADQRYSDRFIAAIDHGLAFLTRNRPQSISEWKQELQPLEVTGEYPKTVLSGHASNQVVSLVKESLTQTVTRHRDDDTYLPDFWGNKDESVSVEFAHKQGFRNGLKVALAILILITGILFIGNYQKIMQVVSHGFVPQDIISDKPVKMVEEKPPAIEVRSSDKGVTEEQPLKPDEPANKPETITELSPPVLDEETAAALQADGKIVIVDETGKPDPQNVKPAAVEPVEVLTGEEIPFENFPAKKKTRQEIILDHETVVERNISKPDNKVTPVATVEKPVGETVDPKVVVIEEVPVPANKQKQESEVVERFKNWVDFLVEHGEEASGKSKELKKQLGGQEQENK